MKMETIVTSRGMKIIRMDAYTEMIFKQLVEEAKFSFEAGGDCDHSVGICACSLKWTIERADDILKSHELLRKLDRVQE